METGIAWEGVLERRNGRKMVVPQGLIWYKARRRKAMMRNANNRPFRRLAPQIHPRPSQGVRQTYQETGFRVRGEHLTLGVIDNV